MVLPLWLFVALGAAVISEQLLGFQWGWRLRTPLAVLASVLFAVGGAGLVAVRPSVGTVLIAMIAAYSIFNMTRALYNRTETRRLFQTVNLTGMWLGAGHVVVALFVVVTWGWSLALPGLLAVLAIAQLGAAIGLWLSVRQQLRATHVSAHLVEPNAPVSVDKLPAITVAVPARNEGQQLRACLDAILANDYPKLEVIVLDDGSADDTPEIIRGYAHQGVRFIRGAAPHSGWLPKNQVYDQLAQEANGKLILFCGVDVRLAPHSIRALEQLLFTKRKAMVGVLPQNHALRRLPLTQAMRYYWEMAPPRHRFRRPPALSSCWLIEKSELEHAGGFAAVKGSISPESHFAREAIRHDGYSFVRSNEALGITSEKDVHEQYETAVFMRYPQLHRRPELVLLLGTGEIVLLAGPLYSIPLAFVAGGPLTFGAATLSLIALAGNAYTFARLQKRIFPHTNRYDNALRYLPAVLYDIWLLHWSMYKYEFAEVIWKGRPIHGPVMHALEVIPQLPALPPEPKQPAKQ